MDVKWAAGSLAIVVKHMCDFIVSYSFNFMMNWSSSGDIFERLLLLSAFSINQQINVHTRYHNDMIFSLIHLLSGTFFIFTSINMFSVLFATKFVPETKGRSLEELQESLNPHLASKTNV